MTDPQQIDQSELNQQARPTMSEAWQEMGQHLRVLGQSLATAFRTAWESEENRQHLAGMQANLEAMVSEVSQTISEAVTSPEAQKVRDNLETATQSARTAAEQGMDEAQAHVLSTLREIRTEVQKMIDRLEKEAPEAETRAEDTASDQRSD